ncbi:MAG: amidase, partial [Pseudonocardia sp.]
RPDPATIRRVGEHYGLGLSDADATSFGPFVHGLLTSWDAVEALGGVSAPPADAPRASEPGRCSRRPRTRTTTRRTGNRSRSTPPSSPVPSPRPERAPDGTNHALSDATASAASSTNTSRSHDVTSVLGTL